jgi:hexosaminidase
MKKLLLAFSLLLTLTLQAQDNLSALIPMPNKSVAPKGRNLQISATTKIVVGSSELNFAADALQNIFEHRMGGLCLAAGKALQKVAAIRLIIDKSIAGDEHYKLKVSAAGLTISGNSPAAVLYGVMTLDQVLLGDAVNTARNQIAPIDIDDAPRCQRRALMLDPARNFLPVKDVKRYIDQMVKYKYNVLQLHLTDDQGWRIEIKGYPRLTEAGPFYTQDEMKDLIAYAADRHVEILPELDIPGHTVAVLAAYPELGCTVNDTVPKVLGKTFNMMLCASQEGVYTLYNKVIAQIAALFPSPYIHLGGDESVIDKNWGKCDRCQALMKEKGYTKASQLMIPFFDKMLGYVREAGKQAILWCELNSIYYPADDYLFPYPKDVILVSWRGGLTPTSIDITARHGNKVLLAPGEYAYFDYPQLKGDLPEYNNWGMPVTTLKKSYEFDPGYGLSIDKQSHIVGVMGTLWGEAIKDINRAFYMTYPRALALSEAGWTQMEHRGWQSFKKRLYPNLLDLTKQGVPVRAPYEIANE